MKSKSRSFYFSWSISKPRDSATETILATALVVAKGEK